VNFTQTGARLFIGIIVLLVSLVALEPYALDVFSNEDVKACENELKRKLSRPLSFERKPGTTQVKAEGLSQVTFEYTAQNGFGNIVVGGVKCVVSKGKVTGLNHFN